MKRSLAALACLASGCGAIFNSPSKQVLMTSTPPGAHVLIDGLPAGVTPGMIPVGNSRDHVVVFRLEGYAPATCMLTTSLDPTYVILDFVLAFPIGVIVDAITGDWNHVIQDTCAVALQPGDDGAGNAW